MGVQIYLLDRRKVTLFVDGLPQEIGTLRRSWKVTEIDNQRAAEMEATKAGLRGASAPLAVMVADVAEIPLADEPSRPVPAHMVIGWDADRFSVTDFAWDYLPVLGYAVHNAGSTGYELHEERGGILYPLTMGRAIQLAILNEAGGLVRRGQPSITGCRSVQPFISTYAQAECVLSDGREANLLTFVEPGNLPDTAWYVGKRPVDVARYPPDA